MAGVLFMAACDTKPTQQESTAEKACPLVLVDTSVAVKWTAYKTTERLGVSGTFDIVKVGGVVKAETAEEALGNATFEIPVSSVNSANPDRDKKIFEHFFSTMANTEMLQGKVLETGADAWKVVLKMNDLKDTLTFEFSQEGDVVNLIGALDVAKWNALASVDSLNQVCFDLHKGADGVSKLWPDVKLEISAQLIEDCN